MSTGYGPRIINDSLVLYLDPGTTKSYPDSGGTWYDLVGNNNVSLGVSTAMPSFTTNNGGHFVFDGINDVANANTSVVNRTNGQELTVSCWIKPARTSGQYSVFCTNRANDTVSFNWIFYQHTTIGAISFHGSSQYNSSYVPETGVWINATNTVTSGGLSTLYINGTPVYSVTNYTYGAGTTLSRLGIGADPGGQEPFSGGIGPVSIYHRALSQSEILKNYSALQGRFI